MKIRCYDLKVKLFLAVFIFCSLLLSSVVFAQTNWLFNLPDQYSMDIKSMVKFVIPGARDEWLTLPNFFYFIVFPFIAAWAVIYGIMEEIRIFRRSKTPQKIISFVMAALLLPSGWLLIIVNYFYAFDAWVALMAFGIIFFIGIFFWGFGTFRGYQTDYREKDLANQMSAQLLNYEQKIRKISEDIKNGRINSTEGFNAIQEVRKEMDIVRERIRSI